jgi:hypothetical protein
VDSCRAFVKKLSPDVAAEQPDKDSWKFFIDCGVEKKPRRPIPAVSLTDASAVIAGDGLNA